MNVAMSLYNLEITFATSPDIDQLIPPTASDIVRDVQDRIAGNYPIIRCIPRGERTQDREQAEILAQFLDIYMQRVPLNPAELRMDYGIKQLLSDMVFDGLVRGRWCLKVIFNPNGWPEEPVLPERPEALARALDAGADVNEWIDTQAGYLVDRSDYDEKHAKWEKDTEGVLPVLIQPRDPRFVMPALDGTFVIEQYDTTADQIMENWPDLKLPIGEKGDTRYKSAQDRVTWTEVWDKKHKKFYADQEVALPKTEHHLGFIPYVIDGPFRTPLRHSGSRESQAFAYETVYKGIESMLKAEAAFTTLAGVITQYEAFGERAAFVESPEGVDINSGPDALSMFSDKDRYEVHRGTGVPPQLLEMLKMIKDRIGDATGTSLLGGGDESGYSRAIRAQIAKLKDRRLEHAMERSLERSCTFVLRIIENVVKGPVYLTGSNEETDVTLKVGPAEIGGHSYLIDVTLNAVLPIDEAARFSLGQAKYDAGIISAYTLATEYGGIRRVEHERKMRFQEDVINSDIIKAFIENEVVKDLGLPGSPEILDIYQQLADMKQGQIAQQMDQMKQQLAGAQQQPQQGQQGQPTPQQPRNPFPASPGEQQQRINQSQAPTPPSPRGAPAMQPAQGQKQQRTPKRNRRNRRRRRQRSGTAAAARSRPVYSPPPGAPS